MTERRTAAFLFLGLCAVLAACGPRTTLPAAARALSPFADSVHTERVADGVMYTSARLPSGPWALHLLEIDERVCQPRIAAVKAGPPLEARALTSELAGASLAAINADFFMLPGGMPVGAHVSRERVLAGPGSRHQYAYDTAGRHWAGHARLVGWVTAAGDSIPVGQVNRPIAGSTHQPPREGVTLFDAWYGAAPPVDSAGRTLRLRVVSQGGEAGTAIVLDVLAPGELAAFGTEYVALQGAGPAAAAWLARRSPGDTVRWNARVLPVDRPGEAAAEAVGGFPMLLEGGRGVVAEQAGVIEGFGPRRHPRTAVGWNRAAGRLFWVVVDGRQPPYSDGMSLEELEWLFLRLGASDAINLDGGGSTAFVLRGAVRNRPSDREGERTVANALVLLGCE